MNKTLGGIGVGIALLAGAVNVPLIPTDMTYEFSYQYPIETYSSTIPLPSMGTSTEETIPNPQPPFPDEDGNGIISVAAFRDIDGNRVFVQIPDAKYDEMRAKDGEKENPINGDYETLIQFLTAPAQAHAAIGIGTISQPQTWSLASSFSWSHTINTTQEVLFVQVFTSPATTITGTYNGANMTTDRNQTDQDGNDQSMLHIVNPDTGTHNVVITLAASKTAAFSSVSYTGAAQTGVPDSKSLASAGRTVLAGAPLYVNATSTVDGAWMITVERQDCSNATPQPSPLTTTRRTFNTTVGGSIRDSNASVGVAGTYSDIYTKATALCRIWGPITIMLAPAAGTVTPARRRIIEIN